MFNKISVSIDMGGCSKRCKHCWIGNSKHSLKSIDELHMIYECLSPFTNSLSISSWYKEPDITNDYKELYEVEKKLSDYINIERFSHINITRLNKDEKYISFIKKIGIKQVTLDILGTKVNHDFFTGKAGNYIETLKATDILLENKIKVNWKIILNKQNINDLNKIILKAKELEIEYSITLEKPIGSNFKNISYRLTKNDVKKIPNNEMLGNSEKELYNKLVNSKKHITIDKNNLVLYIDYKNDIYTNIASLNPIYKLGNIKKESIKAILEKVMNEETNIQMILNKYTIGEMIKKVGNENGNWLFSEEDYILYIVESFCNQIIIE